MNVNKQVGRLASSKPVGSIKLIGNNGYGKDEAGRTFIVESLEQREQRRLAAIKKSDQRHFSFTHMRHIREITDNLSNKICGYVLMLQPYIQYKSNVLIKPGREELPLDQKGVASALKVTPRTAKAVLQELELQDIVEVTREGYYKVNERYHFRKKAKGDKDMLIKTFFTTLKELKLKPAEMGAIYKLLPYVHYETNMICDNPFEEVPANIRFLTTKQIAEVLQLDEKKAITILRALKKSKAIAETTRFVEDGRTKYITLNHNIFYRKQGEPDSSLVAMFSAKPNK
ncbi:hypothetical protein H9655_21115 [Cytobacillus sp. Sa5YUA1]|uniref:Uncharacterized protein n=1 Tax=Cytobacillus stercorigallinarum TaxID=2762240 RepID=A0ABR8QWG1_9BACI|nr:hypothetical protein [Cytobacillus stercorigallinarum]MBD7939547.1 hypothetical protein [Cytobacillus stercorigallinarum]